jgi:hypothetical protein
MAFLLTIVSFPPLFVLLIITHCYIHSFLLSRRTVILAVPQSCYSIAPSLPAKADRIKDWVLLDCIFLNGHDDDMLNDSDILMRARSAASGKVLFLPYAVRQMLRPERMISTEEVQNAIFEGVVIEDYPEDLRGHSCLMLGFGYKDRPIPYCLRSKTGLPGYYYSLRS